jgi:hypothetical protein
VAADATGSNGEKQRQRWKIRASSEHDATHDHGAAYFGLTQQAMGLVLQSTNRRTRASREKQEKNRKSPSRDSSRQANLQRRSSGHERVGMLEERQEHSSASSRRITVVDARRSTYLEGEGDGDAGLGHRDSIVEGQVNLIVALHKRNNMEQTRQGA